MKIILTDADEMHVMLSVLMMQKCDEFFLFLILFQRLNMVESINITGLKMESHLAGQEQTELMSTCA